jgi:HAMP domain-containing protein
MLGRVSNLTSTAGIIAIAAAAVAVVALLVAVSLLASLRRLRAAQRVVLGDRSKDLVAHAAELEQAFQSLTDYVQDAGTRLEQRIAHAEQLLQGAVAYHSLVRYDAYGEMSGHQSTSIALLDATCSGIVLSSIHHRDQARLYAKQVHEGQAELQLSPEEDEAIRLALAGERQGTSPA